MKPIISLKNKRKFGKDIQNISEEYSKNSQENRINGMNTNSNLQKEKENYESLKKSKNVKIKDMGVSRKKKSIALEEYETMEIDPQNDGIKFDLKNEEEYYEDIVKYIIETESSNILNYSKDKIFKLQDDLCFNEEKRSAIIQTLIKYNFHWGLNPDSIFLAVNIIDRYTAKTELEKDEYKLVSLAAFMIGSKYEDVYSPNVKSISNIYDFQFEPDLILEKESQILSALDYSLLYTSSYKILKMIFHLSKIQDQKIYYLSELFLELSLIDLNILKYPQRKRAIAAFMISKRFFGISSPFYDIQYLFGYGESETKILQNKILKSIAGIISSQKKNLILEKYRCEKFGSVFTAFERKINEQLKAKAAKNDGRKK